MRVYWTDRGGKGAPIEARFSTVPFDATHPKVVHAKFETTLPPPKTIRVKKRTFLPDKDAWISIVKSALKTALPKVVLARSQILELEETPDPFALAASLKAQIENSYLICIQEGNRAFLSATPERLFRRYGNQIESEAMAGTRKRGNTMKEDEKLGSELLKSKKDLSEIEPVQDFLKTQLFPFCEKPPHFSPISLHRTKNVQHLYATCEGELQSGVDDRELLKALHPTPALCGTPKEKALDLIRTLEPFDRGLYGGAIGWQTADTSEWIVGIRSCLIEGNIAYLYAGCGIVQGSDPEEEWEELNHKTKLYERIFLDH
ncbi:MAG: isochorismate synthase [Chlamydiae bacterium]|nr:isochorismate synthase [Chlamydiota bacterium]